MQFAFLFHLFRQTFLDTLFGTYYHSTRYVRTHTDAVTHKNTNKEASKYDLDYIEMASEEFNLRSEERRLIHLFDDHGRWISCLLRHEYARTLKKGSNNANADYSLV